MIFFSTTFSPGSGVAGVKELRYLFARFYLWCRLPGVTDKDGVYQPGVKDFMEDCPDDDMLVGCVVGSGCLGMVLFVIFQLIRVFVVKRADASKTKALPS